MEDPAAEYASSLHDLTTNSKPLISMLTMLADEYRSYAAQIVKVIEDYLRRSCGKIKLPTLYLIDSIIKNVGDPYKPLFTENIIKIFVDVFQEGDEKVRSALFKLRQTWKGLLPDAKLYMIDVLTKGIDPNWPICPTVEHLAGNIHLNPRFFGIHQPVAETATEKPDVDPKKATFAKDAVVAADPKADVSKHHQISRHVVRPTPDGQVATDRESGENVLRVGAETSATTTTTTTRTAEQRRSDPRLKRKQNHHHAHQQMLDQQHEQLFQPDVMIVEQVKAVDLIGLNNKAGSNHSSSSTNSSSAAATSKAGSDRKSSSAAKRSRGGDKEPKEPATTCAKGQDEQSNAVVEGTCNEAIASSGSSSSVCGSAINSSGTGVSSSSSKDRATSSSSSSSKRDVKSLQQSEDRKHSSHRSSKRPTKSPSRSGTTTEKVPLGGDLEKQHQLHTPPPSQQRLQQQPQQQQQQSEQHCMAGSGRSPGNTATFSAPRATDSTGGVDLNLVMSVSPSLADKEAAAILTGDVDLRILEPHNKKLKTETPPPAIPESVSHALDLFPKGDIDLRIRPAGGVSDPGQPLVAATRTVSASADGSASSTKSGGSKSTNVDNKAPTAVAEAADDEDEFDKEVQWAKLKGRPVRPVTSLSHDRTTRKETLVDERAATASSRGASTSTPGSDILGGLPLRTMSTRSGGASSEPVALRPGTSSQMPRASSGPRLPLSPLPIVDITPQQNSIPDLFPPGRSRAHIKISDPAPDSGQIRLDGRMRDVRFVDGVAIAVMDEAPPNFVRARQIMFKGGGSKKIIVNEHHQIMAAFDGREHEFVLNGNRHRVRFGAPLRELYVDGIPYACQFNGVPVYIRSREDVFSVTLHPPCPSVNDKMEAPKDLLAKLGLLPMPSEAMAASAANTTPVCALPPAGQVPIASMPVAMVSAGPPPPPPPSRLVGGPSTGGWVRYQEDSCMAHVPHHPPHHMHPGPHGPPGMYPPPGMPHNMPPLPPPPGGFPPSGAPVMYGPPPGSMGGPPPMGAPGMGGPSLGPAPYGPPPMGPAPGMLPPYGQPPHAGLPPPHGHGPPPPHHAHHHQHHHAHMMGPAATGAMMRPTVGPPMGLRPPDHGLPAPPGVAPVVTMPVPTPVTVATAAAAAAAAAVAAPPPAPAQMNVSDLLNQLVTAGIIGGPTSIAGAATSTTNTSTTSSSNNNNNNSTRGPGSTTVASNVDLAKKLTGSILNPTVVKEEIPKLSFKQTDLLKKRYGGVIAALHDGLQCATCGQRFSRAADKNSDNKYAQHLDWHFRMARREREGMKKASSRKWFYEILDWIQFEEVEDIEDRARSYFELQEAQQHDKKSGQQDEASIVQELPSVPAKSIDQGDHTCVLCHEAFELFFCEESEEWRLKNAVLSDSQLFHPACYDDFNKPAREPTVEVKEEREETKDEEIKDIKEEIMDSLPVCDDGSQPLPGLDFNPSTEELDTVKKELPEEVMEQDSDVKEELVEEDKDTAEDSMIQDLNDTVRLAEHSVVVEELGEFGVDSRRPEWTAATSNEKGDREQAKGHEKCGPGVNEGGGTIDESEERPLCEDTGSGSPRSASSEPVEATASKLKVLKGSGGFVLKVKQDTVTNGGDSKAASADARALLDSSVVADEAEEAAQKARDLDDEWVPPQPDPMFRNLPPVKRGVEESGLCSIM